MDGSASARSAVRTLIEEFRRDPNLNHQANETERDSGMSPSRAAFVDFW
jgi:hypothetical protein